MRKTLIAAMILGLAAVSWAQEGALPGSGKERMPRIAVVDMEKVTTESLLGKDLQAKVDALQNDLKADQTKKQAELAKLDAQIKALSDDLEKQQSVLSDEAADKKKQEIVRRQRERDAYVEDGQQELQRNLQRAQQQRDVLYNDFNIKVRPSIDAVVKERGLDLLMDSRLVLFVSKDYEISSDVIVKADDAVRAAKAKASAEGAAAPAKPAAPAGTTAPAAPKAAPKPAPKPQR